MRNLLCVVSCKLPDHVTCLKRSHACFMPPFQAKRALGGHISAISALAQVASPAACQAIAIALHLLQILPRHARPGVGACLAALRIKVTIDAVEHCFQFVSLGLFALISGFEPGEPLIRVSLVSFYGISNTLAAEENLTSCHYWYWFG